MTHDMKHARVLRVPLSSSKTTAVPHRLTGCDLDGCQCRLNVKMDDRVAHMVKGLTVMQHGVHMAEQLTAWSDRRKR